MTISTPRPHRGPCVEGPQADWLRARLREPLASFWMLRGRDFVFEAATEGERHRRCGPPLTGRRLTEVLPEWDAQPLLGLLHRALDTGLPQSQRSLAVSLARPGTRGPEVEERFFDVTCQPRGELDGLRDGLFVCLSDVTEAHRASEIQRFLADTDRTLSHLQDRRATLARLVKLVIPRLADACVATVVKPEEPARRLTKTRVAPEHAAFRRVIEDCLGPVALAARGDEPLLIPELTGPEGHRIDSAARRRLAQAGICSLLRVPLVADGRTLGTLALASATPQRPYTPEDLEVATALAARAALALENARAFEQTRRALELRQDLLSFVSHDLAAPLFAVDTLASLLAADVGEGPEGEFARLQTQRIRQAVSTMRNLVGDLLDLERLEAGCLPLKLDAHPVQQLVADALTAQGPLAELRGVRLVNAVGAEPSTVRCDARRVHQVFANLIGNALRFSPRDKPVTIRGQRTANSFRFTVEDFGPGIPPEELPRIFERFWSGGRPLSEGTGLGLYIARALVCASGGTLWVESTPGVGSRFSFTLPLQPTPEAREPKVQPPEAWRTWTQTLPLEPNCLPLHSRPLAERHPSSRREPDASAASSGGQWMQAG